MYYFFTGMPLAGKSTIARRLAAEEGLPYLSTGDLARSLGMGAEDSIRTRDLSEVHDAAIVARVLEECRKGPCVIDGFPRSVEQYRALRDAQSDDRCRRVVFVTANPLTIFDRMSRRRESEGRPEDTFEFVAGRLKRANEWRKELQAECPEMEVLREEDVVPAASTVREAMGWD
jgi:adenylate kinase